MLKDSIRGSCSSATQPNTFRGQARLLPSERMCTWQPCTVAKEVPACDLLTLVVYKGMFFIRIESPAQVSPANELQPTFFNRHQPGRVWSTCSNFSLSGRLSGPRCTSSFILKSAAAAVRELQPHLQPDLGDSSSLCYCTMPICIGGLDEL